ncbi:MAG: GAF domain-containing protein [Elusimicrobiota bacterium]|nr:GAF domain-containing protein [Elusimicrobiota bacterium]
MTAMEESKKENIYISLIKEIKALTDGESDLIANLSNISAALKRAFDFYSWTGFYFLKNEELVLGPFQGNPACIRIKLGKGVCGICAAEKKAMIVGDVTKFPGHIACDADTKSEIVIPILKDGELKAVLDIDSYEKGSFSEIDEKHLKEVSEICSNLF